MATGSAALSVGHEVASDSSSVLVEHQPAEEEDADQTQLPSSAPQQLLSAQPHSALPSMEVEAAAAAVQPPALAASSSASSATPAAAPTAAADGDADQPPAAALLSASSAVHSEDASATSAPAPSAPPSKSAAGARVPCAPTPSTQRRVTPATSAGSHRVCTSVCVFAHVSTATAAGVPTAGWWAVVSRLVAGVERCGTAHLPARKQPGRSTRASAAIDQHCASDRRTCER